LALGALLAALPAMLLQLSPARIAQPLDRAHLSLAPGDERRESVTLPSPWRETCADCRMGWYEFTIVPPVAPTEDMAIYLPGVGQNVALYLNGEFLGQAGEFREASGRHHATPLLFRVAPALWRNSGNTLFVLVGADPPSRGLMPMAWLGGFAELQAHHRLQSVLRQHAIGFLGIACLILGLVLALIWAKRPAERRYGWLALTAVAWSASQLAYTVTAPPLDAGRWEPLMSTATALATAALLGFAAELSRIWPHRGAAWALLLAPTAALITMVDPGGMLERGFGGGLQLVQAAAAILLLLAGSQAEPGMRRWLLLPGAALLVATAADIVPLVNDAAFHHAPASLLITALVVIGCAWILLLRFVQSLEVAELLNIDLDRLVKERTAALEAQFRRVQALEREQVLIRERERLMRDMHDGIGGHLVSTLAILERGGETRGAVAQAVQGALNDLRLMIDSLDPVEGDLNAVLAMFRDRIEPRLRAAGVTLRWQVGDLPQLAGLGPSAVLSILRILQETVTNTLKHAQAREITIDADLVKEAADGEIRIRVADDGRGFDVCAARGGRGLGNLAHRAAALGGRLEIDSGPAGTAVSLLLPAAGHDAP
jgi:signal transduction histidine kinase